MIHARIENLKEYVSEEAYARISGFLESVSEDMPEDEYPICGDEIYAHVQKYDTVMPDEAKIEAHDKYIDIQFTICGAEGISVFDRNSLTANDDYNEEKDVIHYNYKDAVPIAHTDNIPGYFTLLYPEDAHRPKEQIRGAREVKKAVIKVKI